MFAGRTGVKLISVIDLTLLCLKVGCLGKVGLFGPAGRCIITYAGMGKIAISDPMFMRNFGINLIHRVICSCSTISGVSVSVDLRSRVGVGGNDCVAVMGDFLNNNRLRVRLGGCISSCLGPNSAVRKEVRSSVVRSIRRGVLPRIRLLLPGVSSVLNNLRALMGRPTLTRSLGGVRAAAGDLTISSHRLGRVLDGSIPNVVDSLGIVAKGFTSIDASLGGLSLTAAIGTIGTALSGIRRVAHGLGSGSGDVKLLLGSHTLCSGLGDATSGTSGLLLSLERGPGECMRFSMFWSYVEFIMRVYLFEVVPVGQGGVGCEDLASVEPLS